VIDIRSSGERRLAQLSTLGLVPGCHIRLHQRRPAYVVQVDETEVTLEAEIAQEIIVRTG
jgi:Fe2+ transport system protein FeoA